MVDDFQGEFEKEERKKSLSIRVKFQPIEKTLNDSEIEKIRDASRIAAEAMLRVREVIKIGCSTNELDAVAAKFVTVESFVVLPSKSLPSSL